MIPRHIVLLHGFTQAGGIWVPVMEATTTRAPIDAPDLPGHGSASGVVSDLTTTAQRLAAEFTSAAYVGYSMGGRVALHVALNHPGVVSHLVLCSTTAGIEDDEERSARCSADDNLANRIRKIGVDAFIEEWTAQPMFATLKRSAVDDEIRKSNTAEGLASSLETMGTGRQAPLWSRLHELTMPVLVVTGTDDPKFTAIGRRMAQAIGENATHVEVPQAGHSVPFERPADFGGLLSAFLR